MKKITMTNNLKTALKELRLTRGTIDSYNNNFLCSMSKHASSIHYLLKTTPSKDIFVPQAAQYLVVLVGCLETYFRDIFIFLNQIDINFKKTVINNSRTNLNEIEKIDKDLLLSEYLSKSFNFQNLNDIENAFSPLFNKKLFHTIIKYKLSYVVMDGKIVNNFCIENFFKSWSTNITKLYQERHKIVHDTNYKFIYNADFISKIETLCILFPQVFSIWIAFHYKLKMIMFNKFLTNSSTTNINIPYIFIIHDLIDSNWRVVD